MEFEEVVSKRYATKLFDGKRIPDDKIQQLLELIRLAPSGINLQPWKIRVITDQGVRETLQPAAFGQPQISSCSHLIVFCADTDIDAVIERADRLMASGGVADDLRNMLVGMAKGMLGGMSAQEQVAWAQCQVYLALGNAVNGAKALGFDSCPMTGFNPPECARILDVPSHLMLTAFCPVGYAADAPRMGKLRLPLQDILF